MAFEAKASAPASSLVDNRPAKRSTEALSVIGGGGRKGRTCRKEDERKLISGAAGTLRGARKRIDSAMPG